MNQSIPLDRILQSQGFGTRRACASLVWHGAVKVNGVVHDDPEQKIDPTGCLLEVDGETWPYHAQAYIALNKPVDYECSARPKHYPGVQTLLPVPLRQRAVQPVGRLDVDTTGLLILTDDGSFIHRCTSPKKRVPKVYAVTTKLPVQANLIDALLNGVTLHDSPEVVRAYACEQIDEHCIHLTITEGKYHQVKRMAAAAGNCVEALHRMAIGGFVMPKDWPPGSWHWLSDADCAMLLQTVDSD